LHGGHGNQPIPGLPCALFELRGQRNDAQLGQIVPRERCFAPVAGHSKATCNFHVVKSASDPFVRPVKTKLRIAI
jgi:hypothetical protein